MTATMASMPIHPLSRHVDPPLSECGTLPDIADGIGVTDQALYNLRDKYADFPEPLRKINRALVYWIPEVEAWHREVGRGYGWIVGSGEEITDGARA